MIILSERLDDQAREAVNGAQNVLARLMAALTLVIDSSPSDPIFYHRTRVKSLKSIQDKVIARRIEQAQKRAEVQHTASGTENDPNLSRAYSVSDLKDVAGLRLVTLYDEDIPLVFLIGLAIAAQSIEGQHNITSLQNPNRWIQEQFAHAARIGRPPPQFMGLDLWQTIYGIPGNTATRQKNAVSNPPAARYEANFWNNVSEIRFFRRNTNDIYDRGYTFLYRELHENYKDKVQVRDVDADGNGYSSIHIQYKAPVNHNTPHKMMPVEIQIRTAIEDVWAEVAHRNNYKVRHPYIWNQDLAREYDFLDQGLGRLKEMINRAQRSVTEIREHYHKTAMIVASFTDPQSHYKFSLVMSLIEPFIRGATHERIAEYRDCFLKLDHNRGSEQEDILKSSTKCVQSIKKSVKSEVLDPDVKHLISQLLELELVRLQAIELTTPVHPFDAVNGEKGSSTQNGSIDVTNKRKLLKTYSNLCKMESVEWKIRPIVLFNFWKFYILNRVYRPGNEDARYFLSSAYDALGFDPSIPKISIYRVIIPRYVAYIYYKEVIRLETVHQELGGSDSIFIDNAREFLLNAFKYGLEAWNEQRTVSDRRGDLIYGMRPIENYVEELNLLAYSIACLNSGLETKILDLYNFSRASIRNIADHLGDGFDFESPKASETEKHQVMRIVMRSYEVTESEDRLKRARERFAELFVEEHQPESRKDIV
jgi:ppGpp synthetase/RelA/SpoT-type nucleotidyltranferase